MKYQVFQGNVQADHIGFPSVDKESQYLKFYSEELKEKYKDNLCRSSIYDNFKDACAHVYYWIYPISYTTAVDMSRTFVSFPLNKSFRVELVDGSVICMKIIEID